MGHDPEKWNEFKRRYFQELDKQPSAAEALAAECRKAPATLIFAAKDLQHNQAVALKQYLGEWLEARPREVAGLWRLWRRMPLALPARADARHSTIPTFNGPAIFRQGFRPSSWALEFWPKSTRNLIAVFRGDVSLQSVFAPMRWHVHEMLFGFAAAAATGFS